MKSTVGVKKSFSFLFISLCFFSICFKISEAEARTANEVDTHEDNNIISGHRRPILPQSGEQTEEQKTSDENPTGLFRDKDGDGVKIRKDNEEEEDKKGWNFGQSGDFVHGFIATLSVIIVSELGDKTFFIAAIMAMKHSRLTIFISAMSALSIMHVMSSFFGYAITVIPRVYTFYLSSFLFAVFGIKMLREGWKMSPNEAQEEFEEVQEDLRKRETDDVEAGISLTSKNVSVFSFVSKIFIQAFTMTFLAEWGDRSQLATIVLAAREEIKSVIVGGILGHGLCTGLAVIGGRFIAQRISVRTVTLVGGVVFLIFAATAFFMDPNET